jgi:hypothetical protein
MGVSIIMKRYAIIIIGLVLFSCVENNKSFVENRNFREYIKNNNICISYSIDISKYIGKDFETFDLSNEQKNDLIHFINVFQSSDKYIKNINYENLAKDDTRRIDLKRIDVIGFNGKAEYGIYCVFYSGEKIVDHSEFDKDKNLWRTFNIALFQINNDDIKFNGWHY